MNRTPLRRRTPLRAYTRLRRRTGLRSSVHPVPKPIRDAVAKRAGHACQRCGIPDRVVACHPHHMRLRSQGGKDEASNLAFLCASFGTRVGCHSIVHANRDQAREEGWIIDSKTTR